MQAIKAVGRLSVHCPRLKRYVSFPDCRRCDQAGGAAIDKDGVDLLCWWDYKAPDTYKPQAVSCIVCRYGRKYECREKAGAFVYICESESVTGKGPWQMCMDTWQDTTAPCDQFEPQ